MAELQLPAGWDKAEVNRWLRYHGDVSRALTKQRTLLESALIPVTAYILVAGIECYRRHPELMAAIDAAMPAEQIGAQGRGLGNQIDAVHLWSAANIYLTGRNVLAGAGMLDFEADVVRTGVVLDFWKRAAAAYRVDGTHQCWDTGGINTPYAAEVDRLLAGCTPIRDGEHRTKIQRLNALLTSYLFLLYFDTRAGYQDTGPYELADGRTLLVRTFNKFGPSDFPWSGEVASDLPHRWVTAAFVLEGVELRVTDWGTSVTEPDDYLPHVTEVGLFDSEGGRLEPIDEAGADDLAAAVKAAQKRLYRLIAGMERRDKIDAGAYVYFSFVRPFAEMAGIGGDQLDWTVPRDSLDLYPILETIEAAPELTDEGPYYPLIP